MIDSERITIQNSISSQELHYWKMGATEMMHVIWTISCPKIVKTFFAKRHRPAFG
jgi:hypothetical protein